MNDKFNEFYLGSSAPDKARALMRICFYITISVREDDRVDLIQGKVRLMHRLIPIIDDLMSGKRTGAVSDSDVLKLLDKALGYYCISGFFDRVQNELRETKSAHAEPQPESGASSSIPPTSQDPQ